MAEMLEGGAGVRFSLRFDPMRAGFDRTLVSFPVSALICRLLGWSNNSSQGRSPESVVVVAAAVALYFSALFLPAQQPRRRRLTASAMARPNSGMQLVFFNFSSKLLIVSDIHTLIDLMRLWV